ncbi:MAG: geranylgeranylglycerol-phosphate geranylgeranyltransferase [Bacteroidales bacterium]|jgi:4-hydroxybenzoate polyprenyltransferase|nr:geranylgeranylglycerol-phosphate geranylgeranyltransferase [Bacteroidales bacterium]
MKEFLDLIRWKNLLIVMLTMVLMRYFVIAPLLGLVTVTMNAAPDSAVPMTLQLPLTDFILLIAATVLVTAGGYVINDYFDIKTDLINRGKVIVGTKVSRQRAMMWHSVLNLAGIAIGFYISSRAGYFWMGMLFLLVSGLLYFYSASYKRQFLIGNLMVSVLTALVPLLVLFYEWPALYRFYASNATSVPEMKFLFGWIGGFALFAFLTTLTREIIKDIEDFEGDTAYGRNTVPVVIGIPASKIVTVSLLAGTIALLYIVWFFWVRDWLTLAYLSAAIALPLGIVIWRVTTGAGRKKMHAASSIMKIAMLTGILYSLLVKAIITWKLL